MSHPWGETKLARLRWMLKTVAGQKWQTQLRAVVSPLDQTSSLIARQENKIIFTQS